MNRTEYHFIVTLRGATNSGEATLSASGTYMVVAGMTRGDAYKQIVSDVIAQQPQLSSPAVVFFSLEPNRPIPAGGQL